MTGGKALVPPAGFIGGKGEIKVDVFQGAALELPDPVFNGEEDLPKLPPVVDPSGGSVPVLEFDHKGGLRILLADAELPFTSV